MQSRLEPNGPGHKLSHVRARSCKGGAWRSTGERHCVTAFVPASRRKAIGEAPHGSTHPDVPPGGGRRYTTVPTHPRTSGGRALGRRRTAARNPTFPQAHKQQMHYIWACRPIRYRCFVPPCGITDKATTTIRNLKLTVGHFLWCVYLGRGQRTQTTLRRNENVTKFRSAGEGKT